MSKKIPNNHSNEIHLEDEKSVTSTDFIRARIAEDLKNNKNDQRVHTRFPPEPNGYLHIGHAKSICLNFGIASEHRGGLCNLRFDDTNPATEDIEYVESIKTDIHWLGFDWEDRMYYASDYFEQLYQYAIDLINAGKAYVCSLREEQIRQYRGTITESGKESPYRNRSVAENLQLFREMREGKHPDGAHVLRAKIDMTSANMKMRDPLVYRIRKAHHYRTQDAWPIYPMYDFAHCLSDSLEGITHSICTLEFENNRELYDWFLDQLNVSCHPQQIEFARLNLTYTLLSKRKLLQLVEEGHVRGWDDPRMPTLSGLRRRGYTPKAIRNFCESIGVAKREGTVDMAFLEHCLREDLNKTAPRVMAVLHPLRVIIDNYPQDQVEMLEIENNPEDINAGRRKIAFSRELFIEQDDFREAPPKKFYRLSPGQEVRLKSAYIIKCEHVIKDDNTGKITEIHCTYDPDSKSGALSGNRKVKATLHWVSATHCVEAEVRLYDYLFKDAYPMQEDPAPELKDALNPESLKALSSCKIEPILKEAAQGSHFQFLRQGYFCVDQDSKDALLVFNRTVTLRDTWAKIEKTQQNPS